MKTYQIEAMSDDEFDTYVERTASGAYCSQCGELWEEHLSTGGQCPREV